MGVMGSDDERRYLTASEVAQRLAVSKSTVDRWRFDGAGPPAVRVGTKLVRYDRSEVDRWAHDQRIT